MPKRKHSGISEESINCKTLSKKNCDALRITEMTVSLVDLETDLKEIFQMENKMSNIRTAELFILFENQEQLRLPTEQSNAKRCVRSVFTVEILKVKIILNIHYWCECKMGSIL